ncbi:hypothetical protein P154DRAFT_574561 [Amniculicola lignicola CBS 123094]|uniref:C3H1-type domain-containing protein n=1 Tax=Amniculicola lignicola CBS 123094 TaxID=1392246 RepID=A0A6A5WLY2_9PLEO|nr:hypothetical protein P154DRAFT_574561 [Amniculicola lignicola CBS 123094]
MLSAEDMERIVAHFNSFKAANVGADTLTVQADVYQELIRNCLQMNAELQQKETSTEQKPYVLVLIDAHSHAFCRNLAHDAPKGGEEAARMLHEFLEEWMSKVLVGRTEYQIVVRVFGSLTELVKTTYQQPGQARIWLGLFFNTFSKTYPLFDYVDIRSPEDRVLKITENFDLAINNTACEHIFFGANNHPAYAQALYQNINHQTKISLLRGNKDDPSLAHLPFSKLYFSSLIPSGQLPIPTTTTTSTPLPPRIPRALLPSNAKPGKIPLNAQNQRLDLYIEPPSEKWDAYSQRFKSKVKGDRPCNNFHLSLSGCNRALCEFSHEPLDEDSLYCLRYVHKWFKCTEGGKCRRLDCYNGHVCWREECRTRLDWRCRLGKEMHGMDLTVVRWVDGDGPRVRNGQVKEQETLSGLGWMAKTNRAFEEANRVSEPTQVPAAPRASEADQGSDTKHTSGTMGMPRVVIDYDLIDL